MKKNKISFWYYVVWALGVVALALIIWGIIRALV